MSAARNNVVRWISLAISVASAMSQTGCVHRDTYVITAERAESSRKEYDARWFTREVLAGADRIKAIELVYCPILPAGETVCRTAVVWEAGHSELMPDNARSTLAPPTAAPGGPPNTAAAPAPPSYGP